MQKTTAAPARQQSQQQPAQVETGDAVLLNDVIEKTAANLDRIAGRFAEAILDPETGRLRRACLIAEGIARLRAALDDKTMQIFMPLQGSELGFRTDKDKDGGYPLPTVRECLIAILLRGVYPTGNEFNIIANRSYITKEGYARLVRETPGLTDLDISPGVPRLVDGRTVVRFGAKWRLNGIKHQLTDAECKPGKVFSIKVNSGMGDDAIVGKATRKGLKAIYDMIHGSVAGLDDGEVDDVASDADTAPSATSAKRNAIEDKLSAPNGNGHKPATEQDREDAIDNFYEMVKTAGPGADLEGMQRHVDAAKEMIGDEQHEILTEKIAALTNRAGALKK